MPTRSQPLPIPKTSAKSIRRSASNSGSVRHLEHEDDSRSSGSKFVVDCSHLITDDMRTTAGWLDNIAQLQTIDRSKSLGMSHKKILEGLLRGRTRVVVKIADTAEDLEREWRSYSAVIARCKHTVNFVHYFCYFRCNDSLPRVVEQALGNPAGIGLCQGCQGAKGDAMQVLVMEHVDGRSMKHHDWSRVTTRALQDFIMQALYALLEAHLACGFRHGDFHLDNILVASTQRVTVTYLGIPGAPRVATHGLLAKLMDFELSSVGERNGARELFKDAMEFFSKAACSLMPFVTVSPLQKCYLAVKRWVEDGERDPLKLLSLVPYVRELTRIAAPQGGGGARRDRKRVSHSPRRRVHPDIRKARTDK